MLNGWGDSDGQVNGVRYFKTEPYRAVFVTVDKISPYRDDMTQETSTQRQVKAILHSFFLFLNKFNDFLLLLATLSFSFLAF